MNDGILFLAIMAGIFTLLSISVGYQLTRHGKPYIPFSILVFLFFSIQFFIAPFNRKLLLILIYGLLLIFFIGRLTYLTNKAKWVERDYHEDRGTAGFLTREVLILSIVFGSIAWSIPYLSEHFSLFQKPIEYQSRSNFSESYDRMRNLLYPLRPQQDSFGDGGFTETVAIGSSRSRDDGEVFIAEPPSVTNFIGRYYWKARVFSEYDNGFWSNDALNFSQLKFLDLEPYKAFSNEILPYTFTYAINKEELVTPQIAIDIDREAEVAYFSIDENSQDVIDLIDYNIIRPGDQVKGAGRIL